MNQVQRAFAGMSMALLLFFSGGSFSAEAQTVQLGLESTKIVFQGDGKDEFKVKGSLDNFSVAGADSVRLDFGVFSQVIPIVDFAQKSGKLIFKSSGGKGITKMILDTGKNTFNAKGENVTLGEVLNNPFPVRLVSGSSNQCSMPELKEKGNKWSFKSKSNSQFPCQIVTVPVASPDGFVVNEDAEVRIQAKIPPDPSLDPDSVELFVVDDTLATKGSPVCALFDNGNLDNGDDIGGDGVFSCLVDFFESTPKTIRMIVQAKLAGQTIVSPSFNLDVVEDITDEEAQLLEDNQNAADQLWQDNLAAFGDTEKARQETVQQVLDLPEVTDAGLSPQDNDFIFIVYSDGLEGGILLGPEVDRGNDRVIDQLNASHSSSVSNKMATVFSPPVMQSSGDNVNIGKNNALLWSPFLDQFSQFDEGAILESDLADLSCPSLDVQFLSDSQCTVDSLRQMTQFGTVVIAAHGGVSRAGKVFFATRENTTRANIRHHRLDLRRKRISMAGHHFTILPGFIFHLSGSFQNALIHVGSCNSSINTTLSSAFLAKGAGTYFGHTGKVTSAFSSAAAKQLFTELTKDQKNTGEAFDTVTPNQDPGNPGTQYAISGALDLAYNNSFENGNFETGELTSWITQGDGRVIVSLGEFFPPEGSFMGIVSTGLGFTTDSGSVEQRFCLPKNATQLTFKWNFSSEEFTEFCGSQFPFDDPFEVQLITDSGSTTLLRETVDSLCSSVFPTGLHFDGDGGNSDCVPDSSDDCTVWSTGWLSSAIDISSIASSNNGKGVRLRFSSSDAGDSIFDTAVLLDDIQIVTP